MYFFRPKLVSLSLYFFYCIYFLAVVICPLAFFGFSSEDLTFLKKIRNFLSLLYREKRKIVVWDFVFFSWISIQGEKKREAWKEEGKEINNKLFLFYIYIYINIFYYFGGKLSRGFVVPVKKKKNPRRFPSFSCPRSRFLNLLPSGKFWVSLWIFLFYSLIDSGFIL